MQIFTADSQDYTFHKLTKGRFMFEVRAKSNAHVALSSTASESEPLIEIFVGGWDNSKSAIRFNKQKPEVAEADTPDILTDAEYRRFWISWNEMGAICVGRDNSTSPILSWTNPEPFEIAHVGFRTSWGSDGNWRLDDGFEFHTDDKPEYTFRPVPGGELSFSVSCAHDAHLALTSGPSVTTPMVQVFIGGWENSKSAIRLNDEKPNKAEADTPDVLCDGEPRSFWLRWANGLIAVGKQGEPAFITWSNPEPFPITHVGLRTAWGASGQWNLIEGSNAGPQAISQRSHRATTASAPGADVWVHTSGSDVPGDAVAGGEDGGETLYVGRASHEGDVIPGKVVGSHGLCYIPWGGEEHGKTEYEVLINTANYSWEPASGGTIPSGAVEGGSTSDGETLYVARASHEGSVTVGKLHGSHGTCYIPYGGGEHGYADYEVLVAK